MMPMRDVPIPERLKHRPMFHGVPIPFSAFVHADGRPDFKITDHEKWKSCALHRLCGICGEVLGFVVYFIGGEKSCSSGVFYDPPMHEECARYSFAVCPFIAAGKEYAASLPNVPEGARLQVVSQMPTERPKRMGILPARTFEMIKFNGQDGIFFHAVDKEPVLEWKE